MNRLKELFQRLSVSLSETHHVSSLYFTTDLEKFDFVKGNSISLLEVRVKKAIRPVESINRCIAEKGAVAGSFDPESQGPRLKVLAWPIIEDNTVKGTFGYMVPVSNSVTELFNDIAQPAVESFTENAVVSMITSKARNQRKSYSLKKGEKDNT